MQQLLVQAEAYIACMEHLASGGRMEALRRSIQYTNTFAHLSNFTS